MRVTYTGRSDERIVSSNDFPDHQLDPGVDEILWLWVPGGTIEIPDSVGEWLCAYHKAEFKPYDEPKPEPVAEELTESDKEDLEYLERHHDVLMDLTRDALVDRAAQEADFVATSKTTKGQLVDAIMDARLKNASTDQ